MSNKNYRFSYATLGEVYENGELKPASQDNANNRPVEGPEKLKAKVWAYYEAPADINCESISFVELNAGDTLIGHTGETIEIKYLIQPANSNEKPVFEVENQKTCLFTKGKNATYYKESDLVEIDGITYDKETLDNGQIGTFTKEANVGDIKSYATANLKFLAPGTTHIAIRCGAQLTDVITVESMQSYKLLGLEAKYIEQVVKNGETLRASTSDATLALVVKKNPEQAPGEITYISENTAVLAIGPDGKFNITGAGSSKLTATCDKFSMVFNVVVAQDIQDLNVSVSSISTYVNSTAPIKIDVEKVPTNASASVNFVSKDPSVVTVDNVGNVTIVGEGQTTIEVHAGNITKYITVNIMPAMNAIENCYAISIPLDPSLEFVGDEINRHPEKFVFNDSNIIAPIQVAAIDASDDNNEVDPDILIDVKQYFNNTDSEPQWVLIAVPQNDVYLGVANVDENGVAKAAGYANTAYVYPEQGQQIDINGVKYYLYGAGFLDEDWTDSKWFFTNVAPQVEPAKYCVLNYANHKELIDSFDLLGNDDQLTVEQFSNVTDILPMPDPQQFIKVTAGGYVCIFVNRDTLKTVGIATKDDVENGYDQAYTVGSAIKTSDMTWVIIMLHTVDTYVSLVSDYVNRV